MSEKKSTAWKTKPAPKKRVIKKAEEPIPASEVQPAVEQVKLREIKWDVIGFSSAAVTLLGTAIIFMIGWTYESNWYAYFGVGMEQIIIPPQQILVDSIPTLYVLIFLFIAAFLIPLPIKGLQTKPFERTEIENLLGRMNLLLFVIAMILSTYDLFTSKVPFRNNPLPSVVFLISALLILVTVLLPWRDETTQLAKSGAYVTKVSGRVEKLLAVFGQWKLMVLLLITFLLAVALSASLGIGDAKSGRKGIGGYVQQVYLVSPKPISFLYELEQSCDINNSCIYGPFGFIYENSNSFYLAKWVKEKVDPTTEILSRTPGLFILPRGDSSGGYFIIPVSSLVSITGTKVSLPTPSVVTTLTYTMQPTTTATFTPKPTITVTPKITSTSIPTPTQP